MRVCDICKKGSLIQKCGAHRYGGGWAMRATKKRAVWMVNLHTVKVTYKGVRKTMRLCTKCLRKIKSHPSSTESRRGRESVESKPEVQEKEEKLIMQTVKESTPIASA